MLYPALLQFLLLVALIRFSTFVLKDDKDHVIKCARHVVVTPTVGATKNDPEFC